MTEGVIVKWNYKVGDQVKSGDILAEVETDKATMDMEVYAKGTLLHLAVEEGGTVPVDGVIAVVGAPGEDFKSLLGGSSASPDSNQDKNEKEQPTEQPAEKIAEKPAEQTEEKPAAPAVADNGGTREKPAETAAPKEEGAAPVSDERLKASPLAKKLASEKGIDIAAVAGSGENGRIVRRDIENFQPGKGAAQSAAIPAQQAIAWGEESYEEVNVSQMRKTIAARLAESKFSAPHFYLGLEINMDAAVEARERLNESSTVKISMNDLVVKAAALALKQHPKINSSWLGTKIRYNHHVHIGVAMAVEEGLLVPVIRFSDQKTLTQISTEIKELGKRAKEKKLQPQDWAGNTFTVSNLGMFGIDEFTAIINPPDACILAVGTVKDVAGVVNGEVRPVKTMKVTLSCDHRVVDGTMGAAFLQTLRGFLEQPVKMLL